MRPSIHRLALRWPGGLTLRARLTLWYVGLLGLSLVLFGGYLYVRVQRSLVAQVDAALQGALTQAMATIEEQDDDWPSLQETGEGRLVEPQLLQTDFAVRLLAPDGRIWQQVGGEQVAPPLLPPSSGYVTIDAGDTHWRIYTQPIHRLDGRLAGWVQAAQSLAQMQRALASLRTQALLGLPLALLVAGGSGLWLADRALRPIDRITRTAQSIGPNELDRRIAYRGPSDEIDRLAATIDQMLERLATAFVRERRFIADASHELRTPLTALKGRIVVTLDRPRPPEEYQAALRDLEREVDRLIRLSNDLLVLTRLEQGDLPWQPEILNLGDLLAAIAEQLQPLAAAKQVKLLMRCETDLLVSGAADHLIRLFLNLVDNAIKYTPPGGRVTIQAEATASQAYIAISDTGSGIAPEHLPRLFERFYRVTTDRSRDAGGAGLGIAIAHEIARWHHGSIEAHSGSGHGTTFSVRLPLHVGPSSVA
jgi:heavy metal sensor kinase